MRARGQRENGGHRCVRRSLSGARMTRLPRPGPQRTRGGETSCTRPRPRWAAEKARLASSDVAAVARSVPPTQTLPTRPGRTTLRQDAGTPEGLPGFHPASSSFRPSHPSQVLSLAVLTSPLSRH